MKTGLIVSVVVLTGVLVSIARDASAGTTTATSLLAVGSAIALPDEIVVDDRYLVPQLPASVVEQIPAAERDGDQYLTERVALADLVIGERILAAEDLANDYAHELPGFAAVLLADGFRQDADGTWFYDRYSSWMRFVLYRHLRQPLYTGAVGADHLAVGHPVLDPKTPDRHEDLGGRGGGIGPVEAERSHRGTDLRRGLLALAILQGCAIQGQGLREWHDAAIDPRLKRLAERRRIEARSAAARLSLSSGRFLPPGIGTTK